MRTQDSYERLMMTQVDFIADKPFGNMHTVVKNSGGPRDAVYRRRSDKTFKYVFWMKDEIKNLKH
jgi:hypothetical protein